MPWKIANAPPLRHLISWAALPALASVFALRAIAASPATPETVPSRQAEAAGGAASAAWTVHPAPVAGTLHNGFFLDDRHGWLITHHSGRVLRTADGGESWTEISDLDDGYLETLQFLDLDHGWLCGDEGRLLATEDGGASWRRVDGLPAGAAFYSVHFFDRRRGFLAGLLTAPLKGVLLTTGDGGATWQDRSADLSGTPLTDALQAAADGTAYLGGFGLVLRTDDAGLTWERLEVPGRLAVRGLFFAGAHGWVVGEAGRLLSTADGGATWREHTPLSGSLLRSVVFTSGGTGLIAGDRGPEGASLFATVDDGETWSPVAGGRPDLHRLLLTPRHLWAIGADGALLSADR